MVPSTYCNLRCSYCYELPLLGDKRRAGHDDLRRIFEQVAAQCAEHNVETVRVTWHGGEPLLLPPEYFWRAFEDQAQAFASTETRVVNVTQSNLTVLDEARIDLLANGFDVRGVSLDVIGSLRVNSGGDCKEDLAQKNLDRLLERGVTMTGITVLTRGNRNYVRRIYDFYAERGMNFRLLPLHAGGYTPGKWFEISASDTLRAFKTLANLWIENEGGPWINPIVGVIGSVYRARVEGRATGRYDKRKWESLLIVSRDGEVYPYSDAFDEDASYGNLLTTPIQDVMSSRAREQVIERTEKRLADTCASCDHYGETCQGEPIAEFTQDFWDQDDEGVTQCTVFKGLIEHIERRLVEHGLVGS